MCFDGMAAQISWPESRKAPRCHAVVAAILIILVMYSEISLAAWEIRPIATAGVQYQTNPRMSRRFEDEATGTLLGARLPMSLFSDRTQMFLEPRLVYSFYAEPDDEDLEDRDKYLAGRINRQMARTNYGVSGQYSDVGLRTSEFESAGPDNPSGGTGDPSFLNTTQKRWHFDPYWTFQFTPLNSVSLNAGYNDVTYSRTSVFTRFDYTSSYVTAAVEHIFNEKNKLSLNANASQFDSIEPNSGLQNDSTTTGMSLIYSHALSGTLEASANLGWARTTSEITRQPILIDPEFGPICSFDFFTVIPCSIKSDASNFVGNLSLTKHTEKIQYDVSIGQTVSPNSNGSEVVRRTLSGYMTGDFTERLNGKLGLLIFDQDDVGDFSTRERQYLRLETTLRWKFTRLWAIRGDYRFTYNADSSNLTGDQPSARNHLFFIGIVYSGDGWR
jgi:hypothetical protein